MGLAPRRGVGRGKFLAWPDGCCVTNERANVDMGQCGRQWWHRQPAAAGRETDVGPRSGGRGLVRNGLASRVRRVQIHGNIHVDAVATATHRTPGYRRSNLGLSGLHAAGEWALVLWWCCWWPAPDQPPIPCPYHPPTVPEECLRLAGPVEVKTEEVKFASAVRQ